MLFFVRLAPLHLTATELFSLVNKQLIPVLAYRLMAGPVTDAQLYKIQQSIWHNVAQYFPTISHKRTGTWTGPRAAFR